jgi:hypothetical protein
MQIDSIRPISRSAALESTLGDFRLVTLVAFCLWAVSFFVVSPVDAAEGGRVIEVGAQRAVKTLS